MAEDEVRTNARDGWPPCGMFYVVSFVTAGPNGHALTMRVRRSGITLEQLAKTLRDERPSSI